MSTDFLNNCQDIMSAMLKSIYLVAIGIFDNEYTIFKSAYDCYVS